MKTLFATIAIVLTCSLYSQTMTITETDAQIKKADSIVNHGKVMLSEFFVMRDTAKHTTSVNDFAAAKVIYDNVMANGTVAANDWGTTAASLADSKLMVVNSYISLYGVSFRDRMMAETEKERSKKVKYNGVEYKVSERTKTHFELLNPKK